MNQENDLWGSKDLMPLSIHMVFWFLVHRFTDVPVVGLLFKGMYMCLGIMIAAMVIENVTIIIKKVLKWNK